MFLTHLHLIMWCIFDWFWSWSLQVAWGDSSAWSSGVDRAQRCPKIHHGSSFSTTIQIRSKQSFTSPSRRSSRLKSPLSLWRWSLQPLPVSDEEVCFSALRSSENRLKAPSVPCKSPFFFVCSLSYSSLATSTPFRSPFFHRRNVGKLLLVLSSDFFPKTSKEMRVFLFFLIKNWIFVLLFPIRPLVVGNCRKDERAKSSGSMNKAGISGDLSSVPKFPQIEGCSSDQPSSSRSILRFEPASQLEDKLECLHRRVFGRYTAREALLDEEFWVSLNLRCWIQVPFSWWLMLQFVVYSLIISFVLSWS